MKKSLSSSGFAGTSLLLLPFLVSVFLSAFLLFEIQPLIGKYLLPWFGGGSSVWTTSILFFELLLLLGYTYAFALTQVSLKKQVTIHFILSALCVGLLLFRYFVWDTPITPPLTLKPDDTIAPVIQVLFMLTVSVGLPFFLLSTTSSLVQRWFSYLTHKGSPYPLYALSNTGSLLGLITYPFVIEVLFPLHVQGFFWTGGFIIFFLLLAWCCRAILAESSKKTVDMTRFTGEVSLSTDTKSFLWFILPLISSTVLLSSTHQITQSVAPAPFLWILPLGLYLLSFILCFSGRNVYGRNVFPMVFLVSALAALQITIHPQTFFMNLCIYLVFVFSAFMVLHGELYRLRPAVAQLNFFYFIEALGSAVGGIFVALLAPLLFSNYWEFYLGILATVFISITVLLVHKQSFISALLSEIPGVHTSRSKVMISGFLTLIIGVAGYYYIQDNDFIYLERIRNFYGVVTVVEDSDDNDEDIIEMYNGTISHGRQYQSEALKRKPISYYNPESGVGMALLRHRKRFLSETGKPHRPLHIAVVGLGGGVLATYGKRADRMTFYEINPSVIRASREYFTYLKDSAAQVNIIPGDARLSIEKQLKSDNRPQYDVIVLDAFIDDAIPTHLLTREAFADYVRLLEPKEGVIAVHISNRYLDLEPVVTKAAQSLEMGYATILTDDSEYTISSSSWMLLSYNKTFMGDPVIVKANDPEDSQLSDVQLWTDQYSNLWQVLDPTFIEEDDDE